MEVRGREGTDVRDQRSDIRRARDRGRRAGRDRCQRSEIRRARDRDQRAEDGLKIEG
jgi:hypothetical protein